MPVLRVGLLGYGLAGRVIHAPLITATPDFELASVVTADPRRRSQGHHRAARCGVAEVAGGPVGRGVVT